MTSSGRRPAPAARQVQPPEAERRPVLWRSTGERKGQLAASVTADGGLLLHHLETGRAHRDAWGADAYEATLEIRREDLTELTLVLLAAGFAGQRDGLEQLRRFCERRGIAHRFAVWT
jgi:hypothetical protein